MALLVAEKPNLVGPEVRAQVYLALAHAALRDERWDDARAEIEEAIRELDDSLTPHRRSLLAWTAALADKRAPDPGRHPDCEVRQPGRGAALG